MDAHGYRLEEPVPMRAHLGPAHARRHKSRVNAPPPRAILP
nr:unnamed protein product [Digitaria exilis]